MPLFGNLAGYMRIPNEMCFSVFGTNDITRKITEEFSRIASSVDNWRNIFVAPDRNARFKGAEEGVEVEEVEISRLIYLPEEVLIFFFP